MNKNVKACTLKNNDIFSYGVTEYLYKGRVPTVDNLHCIMRTDNKNVTYIYDSTEVTIKIKTVFLADLPLGTKFKLASGEVFTKVNIINKTGFHGMSSTFNIYDIKTSFVYPYN